MHTWSLTRSLSHGIASRDVIILLRVEPRTRYTMQNVAMQYVTDANPCNMLHTTLRHATQRTQAPYVWVMGVAWHESQVPQDDKPDDKSSI
mmetsp:Transcript_37342/g.74610  ORF Transcript_37342/g.74610 Transcript_37342/m.74610 type:complete len:91 (-) Transcript_37342:172-444(-)